MSGEFKEKVEDYRVIVGITVLVILKLASYVLIALGVIALGFQIFAYLRLGVWPPLSLLSVLHIFDMQWATNPGSWKGLWNVLNFLPLSGSLIVLGVLGDAVVKLD